MKPLNIVYIHAHDLGRFCQPFGYDIPSPNLQKLAEEGIFFRQAHAAAPTCSPSRAALLTGQWPHCVGMYGLASPQQGYTLNDYSHHLASFLKQNGYETALAGVQHVARKPFADPEEVLGYDRFLNHKPTGAQIHQPEKSHTAAIAYLAEKHEKPFFLSVGFLEPHRDNRGDRRVFSEIIPEEPEDIDDRYCQPMPHLPDTQIMRRETANFKMGVEIMDRKMGAVIKAVEKTGLSENTLIICTTDHGPGFPDMKKTLKDRGTGVMLIIRGPEWTGFKGGTVTDAMTTHMDIFPTLCDLLEMDKPDRLQGTSLMPLVRKEKEIIHDMIFTEQSYHGKYYPFRAVRTERYKYIKNFDTSQTKGVDWGPAQSVWEDLGWQDREQPEEELYDLMFDPNEVNNLADRPGHEDILKEMRGYVEKWMKDTDDPLLQGEVPGPPALDEEK